MLDNVNVVSGQITNINLTDIPDLDETKLYYTDSKETYFMPNKSQLTIGNYVTLKAKLTIKDEYSEAINAATLVVDIPSNCELVDNSIISGAGYLGYEYADNRLSVPVKNLSDAIRFCVIPVEGGDCKSSAFVKLVIDNNEILQPIGTVYFEAKNFSLSAPQKTSKTNIAIRGTATADSEVKIYDNDILVGTTYSMPNGEWAINIPLVKPYTYSLHNIHAEITRSSGRHLMTEARIVDYNQSYNDLNSITMAYGKDCFAFDQINGRTNVSNYIYWIHPDGSGYQPKPIFTFIADFANNSPDVISNVLFKVKMLDGAIRNLPAEYNQVSGKWTASSSFSEYKAPVNVTADFDVNVEKNAYCEERYIYQDNALNSIVDTFLDKLEQSDIKIQNEQSDYIEALITLDDDLTENISLRQLSLNDNRLNTAEACLCNIDGTPYWVIYSQQSSRISTIIWSEKDAYEIILSTPNQAKISSRVPEWLTNPSIILRQLLGIEDLYLYVEDYNYWEQQYNQSVLNHIRLNQQINQLLLARCANNDYRLSEYALKNYTRWKESYRSDADYLESHLRQTIDLYSIQIRSLINLRAVIGAASAVVGIANSLLSTSVKLSFQTIFTRDFAQELGQELIWNQLNNYINDVLDNLNGAGNTSEYLNDWYNRNEKQLIDRYSSLVNDILNSYKDCPDDEEDDEDDGGDDSDTDFPTPPVTPIIDPSGYVYEAVPSNRIPGVTATAYFQQQSEDMYGDITETAVVWDAAPFGQENPLTTDAQGMYAWDVPAGMWQVRLEKDGYEPAQSEWLPVPPPQLDVNIAMTQVKQPEIKNVHAYSDGMVIEFDKFMLPSTMTVGNITVTQNGQIVDGEVVASDIELDINGNAFCSKVEYKPSMLFADGEVTLFVSKAVKSYASVDMGNDFMQTFPIEPRISEIRATSNIDVPCGSSSSVTASIVPATAAQGKSVLIESLNPMLADVSLNRVEADLDGNITFDISGLIIGNTGVRLSVEDCDIETIINVNVSSPVRVNQVATPSASVESGEIQPGTEIYLSCDTESASIYYTTDGSCPCDVNRLHYDGTPVIATQDFTLKIIAEADGMVDSEIAEYTYILGASGIEDIQLNNDLSMFPLPLGEYLNISNGDYTIDSVSIYNLGGNLMLRTNKAEKHVSLKVGFLPSGVYLIDIQTNNRAIVKKVLKR